MADATLVHGAGLAAGAGGKGKLAQSKAFSDIGTHLSTGLSKTFQARNREFNRILANQINNPDIVNYLESYKKDYALDETKVVDHINSKLGLDIISIEDLVTKYKAIKQR